MPPLSEILLVLLRLAITTGVCVGVVGTASAVIWWARPRSSPSLPPLVDRRPKGDAPADGFEKGDYHDDRGFDPIQWQLEAIRYRLDELSRGINRLKESLPAYMLKNIAWAVVGATVSIMLEQALSTFDQPNLGRPDFVDFTD